jgi:hypothetical protein
MFKEGDMRQRGNRSGRQKDLFPDLSPWQQRQWQQRMNEEETEGNRGSEDTRGI